MKNYDSRKDTEKHIKRVGFYLKKCGVEIVKKAKRHDYDKIHNKTEKALFDEYTPKLKNCTSKGGKRKMSEVEQLAQEQFNTFRNRLCEMISEIAEEYRSAFIQGYAKGETDEKFRTKQVVTSDSAEVIKLRNQVFIARGLLEKWHKQHSDKDYTKTFYDELIKATEEFLWSKGR